MEGGRSGLIGAPAPALARRPACAVRVEPESPGRHTAGRVAMAKSLRLRLVLAPVLPVAFVARYAREGPRPALVRPVHRPGGPDRRRGRPRPRLEPRASKIGALPGAVVGFAFALAVFALTLAEVTTRLAGREPEVLGRLAA